MKRLSPILLAGSLSLATGGHGLAQDRYMEQVIQTNLIRGILVELRTLNDRLRAADCLRRLSYGAQYQRNKGEELPPGKESAK